MLWSALRILFASRRFFSAEDNSTCVQTLLFVAGNSIWLRCWRFTDGMAGIESAALFCVGA